MLFQSRREAPFTLEALSPIGVPPPRLRPLCDSQDGRRAMTYRCPVFNSVPHIHVHLESQDVSPQKWGLCRRGLVKTRSRWSRAGPSSNGCVRGETNPETQRRKEEAHVRVEAEGRGSHRPGARRLPGNQEQRERHAADSPQSLQQNTQPPAGDP